MNINHATTLRSFVSRFDRYLRKKGYPTAIIEGQEFRILEKPEKH